MEMVIDVKLYVQMKKSAVKVVKSYKNIKVSVENVIG